MTNSIDAQKLAEIIAEWERNIQETKREYAEPNNVTCDAPELYSMMCWGDDIIRQQGEVIRELWDVLERALKVMRQAKVYEVGLVGGQTVEASYQRQCMWRIPISVRDDLETALALAAPLAKQEGK